MSLALMLVRDPVLFCNKGDYPLYKLTESKYGTVLGLWSGRDKMKTYIPPIGSTVIVTHNDLGEGNVRGHFVRAGFIGLKVELREQPEWYTRQGNEEILHAHVFGAEVRLPD